MSSLPITPLDNHVIQEILYGYLPKYVNEFLKNPFIKPSEDPGKYNEFLTEALECRDFNNVFWLMDELYPDVDPFTVFCPRKSAESGILPAVKWLITVSDGYGNFMLSVALRNGQYEVCEWLISNGEPWSWNDIQYIEDHNIERFMETIEYDYEDFAYFGMINILKYIHSIGVITNKGLFCDAAVQGRNVKCLEFLVDAGYPLNVQLSGLNAAKSGSLECLKFMHEKGYIMDGMTCATVAAAGSIECLKYAREANCPWDSRLFDMALPALLNAGPRYRTLGKIWECIEYARENGCPEIVD